MLVDTIQMDPRIAALYYRDYRHKVRANRVDRRQQLDTEAKAAGRELGRIRIAKNRMEHEDEELMKAYRALSKGQRILNLPNVLKKAGVDKQHLPILAIAQADWTSCYFHAGTRGVFFSSENWVHYSNNRRPAAKYIPVASSIFPAETTDDVWRRKNNLPTSPVKALIPAIPAHLRPHDDLSKYHVLWEAKWEPTAPVDPFLLKRVTENTYIILAQWDLTPIEQAILETRL